MEYKGIGLFCQEKTNIGIYNTLSMSELQLSKKLWPDLSLEAGMRVNTVKINRSGVYFLISTVAPINHALKAEFDAIGSVIVVGLLLGIVSFVRFALVWVQ
jgi:hypothetical protein